jgi:hypothetical protein
VKQPHKHRYVTDGSKSSCGGYRNSPYVDALVPHVKHAILRGGGAVIEQRPEEGVVRKRAPLERGDHPMIIEEVRTTGRRRSTSRRPWWAVSTLFWCDWSTGTCSCGKDGDGHHSKMELARFITCVDHAT